ncbi:serine hydrolase domain-containing protein [Paenibacillus faecalis]|uniref:serine hydrolase domain-containing protein n=1 Tax=Paenibacillus faecalis TaxID=2079532 RepID=UPI001F47F9EA|nr:serine hydrolase [Paenibacillus faecalis]
MLSLLKHYVTKRSHPLLHQITFRHLLTMTAGFAWQTGKKLGEPLIHQFHRNRKWASFALSLPIKEKDLGTTFQYRSTDSHLLSVALSEATGMNAYAYADKHLFSRLGVTHHAWTPSPEGHSMGHVGLYLTSRDMAKFGLCCLNAGKWQKQQIIPKEWLQEALTPQADGYPAFGDYGFQWWTGKIDGQVFSLAHGHGGQQIYLFPDSDAVIIFTQESKVSRWRNPRMLIEQFILKSLK